METLLQDIRYGLRMLRKNPGYTALAALILALGIGANSAIFSLVNGILLAPLPFAKPNELVSVTGTYPKGAFVAMREQVRTMEVATYSEGHEFNLTGNGEPLRLTGTLVSAELMSILGVRPELGQNFHSGEDLAGDDNYVLLSHALWLQRFNGDPGIVGRSIQLEGISRQVVGVMPESFRFPSTTTQIWVPLHNDARNPVHYWADDFMPVVGRLRPGVTIPQARAEIRMFQSHVFGLFPWRMPASWNADVDVILLQRGMVADIRTRLLILLAAVAMVLLIACTNVANLTLSRAATREKEMSIRSALGAGRQRLTRQLLTECVLLACVGGALGLAFAAAGLRLLKAWLPVDTPRLNDVYLDWHVLLFTGIVTVLTGVAFGLAPALQASRAALADSLKAGGRAALVSVSQRLRGSLAVAEVALAVLLVVGAGLLIRSFWALSHVDPGFETEHIVTARITPNQSLCNDSERCLAFYRDLLEQVKAAPGVKGTALVNTLPLSGRVAKRSVNIENSALAPGDTSPLFWLNIVSPDYQRVMGMTLRSGRWFTESETTGNPPVAVMTNASATKFWPGEDPIGKHIRLLGEERWRTVIGIVADVRAYNLQAPLPAFFAGAVYVPFSPTATLEDKRVPADMTIVVRTITGESQTATLLSRIVTTLNPEVPVSEVKSMQELVTESVSTPASTMSLFATFAGLALVLGIVGIYGVLSFLVSRRTREIGIRFALGAQRSHVLWLVLKEGIKFSLVGIALGLVGAFALTRWLASELYGIRPLDPFTYFFVAIVTTAVTLVACYIPTRRAMQVDPLVALRFD